MYKIIHITTYHFILIFIFFLECLASMDKMADLATDNSVFDGRVAIGNPLEVNGIGDSCLPSAGQSTFIC